MSPADAPTWLVRRRPPARFVVVAALIALPLSLFGAWLMRALMLVPGWEIPVAMGAAIAAAFVATAARRATATLDADGILRYGWGAAPAVALDLREVAEIRPVRAGLYAGVGLAIPPERVHFLHRRGPSPRRMRDDRARLGVDLVLEFLSPDDAARLAELRAALPPRA